MARLICLLLLAAAVCGAAAVERIVIPNMALLSDFDTARASSMAQRATTLWPTNDACAITDSPCKTDVLSTWFDKQAGPTEKALLLSVLAKDTYPRMENLGVRQDNETAYQCKLTAKWTALGAEAAKFVTSELTNIAVLKAARNVFINYRGTWTVAQDANNHKEAEHSESPIGGEVHHGWLTSVGESWPQLLSAISSLGCNTTAGAPCELHVSGHSRGGALAVLAAVQLPATLGRVASVTTFGAPRVGNGAFQKAYAAKFGNITAAYWNARDFVPRHPPNNAQAPRLRLSEGRCPTAPSMDNCFGVEAEASRRPSKAAVAAPGSTCARVQPTFQGAKDHRERSYMDALFACIKPGTLPATCLEAL